MKKHLISIAIVSVCAAALYSCNNGAYDATPDKDYSAALSPFVDGELEGVQVGSMIGVLNGKTTYFSPAYGYEDTVGNKVLVARVKDDSIFDRRLMIVFTAEEYKGKLEYPIPGEKGSPIMNMTMIDTTRVDKAGRPIYKTLSATMAKINIAGDEGGFYRGDMEGVMYRTAPEQNNNDSVKIEKCKFYFDIRANIPERNR
ncbi:MAG: hypothetical protein H6551_04170 [Chitinophagales bacterium]|nr:hypothetical protein [Chitinophagales bacterium]